MIYGIEVCEKKSLWGPSSAVYFFAYSLLCCVCPKPLDTHTEHIPSLCVRTCVCALSLPGELKDASSRSECSFKEVSKCLQP